MDQNEAELEPMETGTSESSCSQDSENNNEEEAKILRKKHKKSLFEEQCKQTIMASGKKFMEVFRKILLETKATREEMFLYLQRVYHAIFFYGFINRPKVQPSDFIPSDSWDKFKNVFPKPLQEYNTHLPCQTPYSILLEYIFAKCHNGNPDSILKELEKWNTELLNNVTDDQGNQLPAKDFSLSACVITHSCVKDSSGDNIQTTAFGSSIAYKGSVPRRIMIAISALFVWDKVISYEVNCAERGRGIHLPKTVCCNSYKFETESLKYEETSPCVKCHKKYFVQFDPKYMKTNKKEDWRHGNCAETESLSNLIHFNEQVKNAVFTTDENQKTLNREIILKRFSAEHEHKLRKEAKSLLESQGFKVSRNGWALFTPAEYVQR
ncbi:uncharacterized protein [Pyxicephalus adspersus]|uniref:uncharacterized protein n=1 Tax=Pyxicephalus adspersus TaxID=30357 RepID=UPI003B5C9B65